MARRKGGESLKQTGIEKRDAQKNSPPSGDTERGPADLGPAGSEQKPPKGISREKKRPEEVMGVEQQTRTETFKRKILVKESRDRIKGEGKSSS